MNLSQNAQISSYLSTGKTLTSIEALRMFGTFRLSARIHNLKDKGLNIKAKSLSLASGKRVAQYYIEQ